MSIERKPLTKDSRIVLVSKAPSPDGRLDTPRGAGVLEGRLLPTMATPQIHAVLDKAGFKNIMQIDTQYNPEGLLTKEDMKTIKEADVLMVTAITRTAPPTLELVRRYRELRPQGTIFMGGHHVSASKNGASEDEKAILAGVDVVVRNEGYKTVVEAMESLINNGHVDGVEGVTHKRGQEIVPEKPRPLLTVPELVNLPKDIYSPHVLSKRDADTKLTSIGCPFGCNFCCITEAYGNTYRRLPNDKLFDDFEEIFNRKPQKGTFVIDDNFLVQKGETKSLLKGLIDRDLVFPKGSVIQIREGAGSDPEFLELLSQVRMSTATVGIESINDAALLEMNKGKGVTRAKIEEHIKAMKEIGKLRIHGMFIVGFDADTKESLRELLDWAIDHVDTAQFFPLNPLPGTENTMNKEREGRIISKKYHRYDGTNVLLEPKNFTPWELQQIVINMYREFYSYRKAGKLILKDYRARGNSKSRLGETYDNRDALAKDLAMRAYANVTIDRMLREPARIEYFKALKDWKPGQII